MIEGVVNADSLPVLERMMQFSAQRHALITNNIANFSTPGYRPQDVSVEQFQLQLRDAIDTRREAFGATGGELQMESSPEIEINGDAMTLRPENASRNILFHDRNDRDLERTMQDLVENFTTFRTAAQFMRSRFDLINTAIRERI